MASRMMSAKGVGVAAKKYLSSKSCSNIATLKDEAIKKQGSTSTVYQSERLVVVDGAGELRVTRSC